MRYSSIARLSYEGTENRWLVAYVDKELSRYYLSLLPKAWYVKSQMYPSHITCVRLKKETIPSYEKWGLHQGVYIPFTYSPIVQTCGTYFWLDVWSDGIMEVRKELGLPALRAGFDRFHITIGNTK